MNEVAYYREALTKLRNMYVEKRSDVSDIVDMILDKEPLDDIEELVEHRYVHFNHNGTEYEYDTLTTLVEYQDKDGKWKVVSDIQYLND